MAGPERLRDVMEPGQTLKLVCGDCPHRARWSRARAIAVFGPDATPHSIRSVIFCTKCGSTNCDVGV